MTMPEIPGEPLERVVEIHHHHYHPVPQMQHGWLKFVVRDLETNPKSQFAVHKWGMYYWLLNFPLITCLFFFAPALWLKLGIFITLIYSIYANFATDYGSMSAAMAAMSEEVTHATPPTD